MYSLEEIKENEKWSKLNGSAAVIAQTILNTYLPFFAISAIGVTNYQLGWINSMPALISLLVLLPGAWWMNHLERKKEFTFTVILFMRLFIVLIAITPFVQFMNQGWWLIIAIAIMNIPTALAGLSWQSFIGDLIPESRRASFFSERNRLSTIVGLITTIIVGFILNLYNRENPLPYQFFFAIAIIFGLIEAYYLYKHKEKTLARKKEQKKEKQHWYRLFTNYHYSAFLISAFVFHFGWQMAWPIFNIYQIKIANASALWISIFTVANQLGQIISFKWWGRYSEKKGNAKALFWSCLGMGITPIITIWSTNFVYLTFTNIISGLSLSGITLVLFNQLLQVSDAEERTNSVAYYQLMVSAVGFISPQVGVWFYETLGLSVSMNVSGAIRILGGLLFLVTVVYAGRIQKGMRIRSAKSI